MITVSVEVPVDPLAPSYVLLQTVQEIIDSHATIPNHALDPRTIRIGDAESQSWVRVTFKMLREAKA